MNIWEQTKSWYRALPDKKRYIEFMTALLTLPVLLTVIITNVRNLQSKPANAPAEAPGQAPQITFIPYVPGTTQPDQATTPYPTPSNQPATECRREVGPVEIVYPREGETVTGDPVCIDISYRQGDYCSVVWSYRINSGAWSQYTDRSICFYSITAGEKIFDVRVKSIASSDEILLTRRFTVTQPAVTPQATGSGTLQ